MRFAKRTARDIARSKRLKLEVNGQPRVCYRNAFSAAALDRLMYVEGVALCDFGQGEADGLWVQHGWCETLAGIVIDPTHPEGYVAYRPFDRWRASSKRLAKAILASKGRLPLSEARMHEWNRLLSDAQKGES